MLGEDIIGMQRQLLEPEFHNIRPNPEFLQSLSRVIGCKWPYLATLLSLSSTEIECVKNEGEELSPADHALIMLKKWSSQEGATYSQLFEKLKPVSLFHFTWSTTYCVWILNFHWSINTPLTQLANDFIDHPLCLYFILRYHIIRVLFHLFLSLCCTWFELHCTGTG